MINKNIEEITKEEFKNKLAPHIENKLCDIYDKFLETEDAKYLLEARKYISQLNNYLVNSLLYSNKKYYVNRKNDKLYHKTIYEK